MSVHREIALDIIFSFLVETLNYTNTMSRIDYLFITSKYEKSRLMHFTKTASYLSFHSLLHNWCNTIRGMCCLCDGAYKRALAANWKE